MASMDKVLNALVGVLSNAQTIQAGMDLFETAKKIYDTIGKPAEEISDADLDLLASGSDSLHEEVQQPIPDDEEAGGDGGAQSTSNN